ncbi:hemicentin-2-like isoform X2 [Hyposmocoma kahamanoa]|uniref:hemicentin-2-like isoform X2 n=1 Tax=Hyposmocoma kahamanoa TaxID=1477025 RepID=UPI000E6D9736|nr:hemicentin-2-like isoform X2 [Hyposmocoma kahamanoa]
MRNEISIIKRSMTSIAKEIGSWNEIENYILLSFSDPDLGPPVFSLTPEEFTSSLNRVTVNGGDECPENALTAIQKGLEISNPDSFIFVFTDAYAKDYGKITSVQNLCETTHSKIVIFLNGYCDTTNSSQVGSIDAYYKVAESCNGAFFRMDMSNFRKAFTIIKELTQDWTEINNYNPFVDYKQLEIDTDSFTTQAVVAVYGNYPEISVTNDYDQSVPYRKITQHEHFTVLRLNSGESHYKVNIRSQGTASATLYKKTNNPFLFGFSSVLPNSIKETSTLPLPVRTTNLIVPATQDNIEIRSAELYTFHNNEKRVLNLEKNDDTGFFTVSTSFSTNDVFQIHITGTDILNDKEISSSTRILKPQKQIVNKPWIIIKPTIKMIESSLSPKESGEEIRVPCIVTGNPKPNMVWVDDQGNNLPEILLEIPAVYIIYGTVTNLTRNMTLHCQATNYYGDSSGSIDLYMKRTNYIDVITMPQDSSIEYGTEGKIYCQVNANPEPTIKWYHNGTLIEDTERILFEDNDAELVIKSMDLDDVGEYKCEVSTTFETKELTAKIDIAGLEGPELSVTTTDVNAKIDDVTSLECTVDKGTPTPTVTWSFKSLRSDYFSDIPSEITVTDSKLEIPALKNEHGGIYKCEASNIIGQASRDITVHVQSAPIINSISDYVEKAEGEEVELICDVAADPEATVRWEMIQNDAAVPMDYRHYTDDQHTHRFIALWKDSGNYRCVAENSVGRAEKVVQVNVLVRPIITRPKNDVIMLKTGSSITLKCDVVFGNPLPSTRWEFIAADFRVTVLSRGSTTNDLYLPKVSNLDEGLYKCRADNAVGFDHIIVRLNVV